MEIGRGLRWRQRLAVGSNFRHFKRRARRQPYSIRVETTWQISVCTRPGFHLARRRLSPQYTSFDPTFSM
ncbi:hypothetical protein PsYK624_014020 [Phanerochaete sordida]|uniref:Uncharacterized protein n=1 Tax=Phanerochaete sordida TaxID=48140 RepID=A0A9P3FY34_9APHY|nr:hypothetical protein PsYK624_014020 [Phanerochaete sordida]